MALSTAFGGALYLMPSVCVRVACTHGQTIHIYLSEIWLTSAPDAKMSCFSIDSYGDRSVRSARCYYMSSHKTCTYRSAEVSVKCDGFSQLSTDLRYCTAPKPLQFSFILWRRQCTAWPEQTWKANASYACIRTTARTRVPCVEDERTRRLTHSRVVNKGILCCRIGLSCCCCDSRAQLHTPNQARILPLFLLSSSSQDVG